MKKIPGVTIRKARARDLLHLMVLEDNFSVSERWHSDEIENYLNQSLRDDKTPLLIAFGKAVAGTPAPAGYCLGDIGPSGRADICSLVVAPEFRHRKLGSELLNRICKSLRNAGARQVFLQVKIDNKAAIRLYEGAGFVKSKILRGYYDGVDGMEMQSDLAPLPARRECMKRMP